MQGCGAGRGPGLRTVPRPRARRRLGKCPDLAYRRLGIPPEIAQLRVNAGRRRERRASRLPFARRDFVLRAPPSRVVAVQGPVALARHRVATRGGSVRRPARAPRPRTLPGAAAWYKRLPAAHRIPKAPGRRGATLARKRTVADSLEGTSTLWRERRGGVDVPSTSPTLRRPCRCRWIDRAGEEALGQSERRIFPAMFWSYQPGAEP